MIDKNVTDFSVRNLNRPILLRRSSFKSEHTRENCTFVAKLWEREKKIEMKNFRLKNAETLWPIPVMHHSQIIIIGFYCKLCYVRMSKSLPQPQFVRLKKILPKHKIKYNWNNILNPGNNAKHTAIDAILEH
jgi:hypothetical protein